jgi:outer membrane protein assembly factor BamB
MQYFGNFTVTYCDLHGTTQWEFKDERLLQYPLGISVDNDGNVYVGQKPTKACVVLLFRYADYK